jgi:hypothetical protein
MTTTTPTTVAADAAAVTLTIALCCSFNLQSVTQVKLATLNEWITELEMMCR